MIIIKCFGVDLRKQKSAIIALKEEYAEIVLKINMIIQIEWQRLCMIYNILIKKK